MKNIYAIILFVFIACSANSQDRALYTQYFLNPALINPAYSGFNEDFSLLSFNYRNRWSTFPGSPHSYTFNYHTPVGDRLGLGATIFSENISSINRFRAQLAYAYKFQVDQFKVSMG
ncbi:MAG: PorP/SprF family type IX secretion system membrane protein, partial [Bacteroidota bacterium]